MSAASPPSTRRALTLAFGLYLLWVLATYLLEGRIHTFLRPEGLYTALKPGGILSVTEIFGDPDYRRPASVRREVEPAGFELVERFGGFPAYTLNFRRLEYVAT